MGKYWTFFSLGINFCSIICNANIFSIRIHKTGLRMSFMRKQRWDSMIHNSSLGYTLHGGSVPNLLSPPRSEGLGTLQKRLSMEVLRGWAPDLGSLSVGLNLNLNPVKWPSLVTVCKWKQTLTEKLKKRNCVSDESQVRNLPETCDWEMECVNYMLLECPGFYCTFLSRPLGNSCLHFAQMKSRRQQAHRAQLF